MTLKQMADVIAAAGGDPETAEFYVGSTEVGWLQIDGKPPAELSPEDLAVLLDGGWDYNHHYKIWQKED